MQKITQIPPGSTTQNTRGGHAVSCPTRFHMDCDLLLNSRLQSFFVWASGEHDSVQGR